MSTQVAPLDEVRLGRRHPLADLPRVDRPPPRLPAWLARGDAAPFVDRAFGALLGPLGLEVGIDPPEILERAAGLDRPGAIVHLAWPRLRTRVAVGLEVPLAHAVVDHLLGFWRFPGQERLQVTPVEWGLLAFAAERGLAALADATGPFGPWDLVLDRVSPDPFRPDGLGPIATLRFPVRLGETRGSARLWLPRSLLDGLPPGAEAGASALAALGALTSSWAAEVGTIPLPRGLARVKAGAVLPLAQTRLKGPPDAPVGRLELVARAADSAFVLEGRPEAEFSRVRVHSPIRRRPSPRDHIMDSAAIPSRSATAPAADVPVTLAVELGRVTLSVSALAELQEGDLLTLGRTPREPVELTSGGRLVARGDLVQIDTELGVKLTKVYL